MARISRTAIERILNMRPTEAPATGFRYRFHEFFNNWGWRPVRTNTDRNSSAHRRRRVEIARQDRLAGVLIMRVAALDLLRDRMHVAKAALEGVGVEHGGGAGHVIG